MRRTLNETVDLRRGMAEEMLKWKLVQHEVGALEIRVAVMDGEEAADLEGCAAVLETRTPMRVIEQEMTVEGSLLTCVLDSRATDHDGFIRMDVELRRGDNEDKLVLLRLHGKVARDTEAGESLNPALPANASVKVLVSIDGHYSHEAPLGPVIEDLYRSLSEVREGYDMIDSANSAAERLEGAAEDARARAEDAQAAAALANEKAGLAGTQAGAAQTAAGRADAAAESAQSAAGAANLAALRIDAGLAGAAQAIVETSETGETLTLTDSADAQVKRLTVYGKSVQNGVPSPSSPAEILSIDHPVVHVSGTNLFDGESFANEVVRLANGTVDRSAKTVTYHAPQIDNKRFFDGMFKPNTVYTLIIAGANIDDTASANIRIEYTDGTYLGIVKNGFGSNGNIGYGRFVTASGKSVRCLKGVWHSATSFVQYDKCAIIEGTSGYDDYVPFVGASISIPYTLRSIDDVADTLTVRADGTGELVQRILCKDFDSSSAFAQATSNGRTIYAIGLGEHVSYYTMLCDKFKSEPAGYAYAYNKCGIMSNESAVAFAFDGTRAQFMALMPMRFMVVRLEPVTTQLTAEQVTAIMNGLRTYKPVTNLSTEAANGVHPGLEVEYVADTKTYVDNVEAMIDARVPFPVWSDNGYPYIEE